MKLDLAYRRAGVVLCHTCRLTIQDVTLAKGRRGTGSALDFIVGDDDVGAAAVVLQDVRRHRLACTPSSSLPDVLEGTPRSKTLPPSPTGEQKFALKTVNVQVRLPAGADRSRAGLGAQSRGSVAGVQWTATACRARQLSASGGPGGGIGMALQHKLSVCWSPRASPTQMRCI